MRKGIDLNSKPAQPMLPRVLRMRRADEFWQIDLCTTDGLSSCKSISPLRSVLSRRLQTQKLFLLGPVSVHGLRATNLSRESARYRSLPARATDQALSSWHSRPGLAQHPGSCQLGARLAHLRRLRASADYPRPCALRGRQLRRRVGPDCLCARCHHHRFVPGTFSLGQVSPAQRSGETAHPARPARQHSNCCDHYPWQGSRGQYSGSTQLRSRGLLCDGSRLSRFRAPLQIASRFRLLCHPRQKAFRFPATLFTTSRPSYRSDLRSDHYARQSRSPQRLSREAASHSLLRFAKESTTRLSDQQLQLAITDDRATVSQPLAGRVVLQMDQTTPTHQKVLRHFRECPEDSNLDCHLGLRARGDRQKATQSRRQSLQNVTDLQRHSFRENPDFTCSFFNRRPNHIRPALQTTDSVQLTLGQYWFYISNRYYDLATGELDKSIDVLELWERSYPRDVNARINLAFAYAVTGQAEKVIPEAREAMRLNANAVQPYNLLGWALAVLGQLDEAKAVYQEALTKKLDAPQIHVNLYGLSFIQGDQAVMQQQIDWSAGKPFEGVILYKEADTLAFSGQQRKSQELFRRATSINEQRLGKDAAAHPAAEYALSVAMFGDCQQAKKEAATALSYARGNDGALWCIAVAVGLCGESIEAQSIADELVKGKPKGTLVNAIYVPTIRAAIETNRNNPAQAIQLLQTASRFERFYPLSIYVRGLAYLSQRSGAEAALEFQKIIDQRFNADNPLYQLAYLGLARAAALTGDRAKSREAYEHFFELWKNADSNIRIQQEARREYEKLG